MKVVGLLPSPSLVQVALVEGDPTTFTVPFRDEWKLADEGRLDDYVEIRKRLVEHMSHWNPDAVCIVPLEGFALSKGRPTMPWFKTAELRGVLAEAARSAGVATEFRNEATVSASLGLKTAAEYRRDDVFWDRNVGTGFLKKYRDVVLVAVSRIRQG
jgi:hypothetical protein